MVMSSLCGALPQKDRTSSASPANELLRSLLPASRERLNQPCFFEQLSGGPPTSGESAGCSPHKVRAKVTPAPRYAGLAFKVPI
jgi:hypothetical protein